MGLDLTVGVLAELRTAYEEGYKRRLSEFDAINTCLGEAGLQEYQEPDDCAVWSCGMVGYTGLHYLRRLAAHLGCSDEMPSPGDQDAWKDPMILEYRQTVVAAPFGSRIRIAGSTLEGERNFDHLMVHSDASGYYVPVDFAPVLVPGEGLELAGDMIGSSFRLLAECERIAATLGIPDGTHEQSEALFEAMGTQGEGDAHWQRCAVEAYTCVALMRGCQESIETGAALAFV